MLFSMLLRKKRKSKYERIILAAVCALSVQPKFKKKTPSEVYDWLVNSGEELFNNGE